MQCLLLTPTAFVVANPQNVHFESFPRTRSARSTYKPLILNNDDVQ